LVVVLLLIVFAGDGLRAPLTGDDLMNSYQYWSHQTAQLIQESIVFYPAELSRPLGALFYSPLLALFGLNPLPYRIVSFALIVVNLGLLYLFCLRLTHSREIAALACVLGAYHAHLDELYYNSGTIYDLMCFAFYYGALVYYLRIWDAGSYPGWRQMLILVTLYIAALSSKEMAVTLPVIVLVYELLFHKPIRISASNLVKWLVREGRFLWLAVPITIAFVLSRVAGPHPMTTNDAYHLDVTAGTFMNGWAQYLYSLFYTSIQFTIARVIILWVALLVIALAARRRELFLAWAIILVGVLPVIFIPPRAFYAIYMTLPAWYLFFSVCLVRLRDLLAPGSNTTSIIRARARQIALFAVILLFLGHAHRSEKARYPISRPETGVLRAITGRLKANYPSMQPGANILFLSDPLDPYDWTLTFLFRLHYRDKEIRVDRFKLMTPPPDALALNRYYHIFDFSGGAVSVIR
jgi:hypothetical protein